MRISVNCYASLQASRLIEDVVIRGDMRQLAMHVQMCRCADVRNEEDHLVDRVQISDFRQERIEQT